MENSATWPRYQWLVNQLRAEIVQGDYQAGDLLPTEHQLMETYGLSNTTVRRALSELRREGWIYRQAGKGTFVRHNQIQENLLNLTSFAEEMRKMHVEPGFRLLDSGPRQPSAEVSQKLHLKKNEPVFLIRRLQLAKDTVIAVAVGYWQPEIGLRLAEFDLNSAPLYEILENNLNIRLFEAEETISARLADGQIGAELGVEVDSPLLVRSRISYNADRQPVEFTETYYRADRYVYKLRLLRHNS